MDTRAFSRNVTLSPALIISKTSTSETGYAPKAKVALASVKHDGTAHRTGERVLDRNPRPRQTVP